MYQILIVDDETIIRTTLQSLISWEKLNCEVAGCALNGKQAMQILEMNRIDVVITDMKMPIMDGLQLLQAMESLSYRPIVIVLSGYHDFVLVRDAFRYGIYDYLLKADLSEGTLMGMMERVVGKLNEEKNDKPENQVTKSKEQILLDVTLGKEELNDELFTSEYVLVLFEIDNFLGEVKRFGTDLETNLIIPMTNFARQIPKVAMRCILTELTPSRYLLLYEKKEEDYEGIKGLTKQIMSVWKNYMNISTSVGISRSGAGKEDFFNCYQQAGLSLSTKYIYGRESIFLHESTGEVNFEEAVNAQDRYQRLKESIFKSDENELGKVQKEVFARILSMDIISARKECIYLIYQIALMLKDSNEDIWSVFGENINYLDKLKRIYTTDGLVIWMTNFIRWIVDYLESNYDKKQANLMEKAKRYIWDNYSNLEISLGQVAESIGLSEKYFSSRFTKEVGNTFSYYLAELRIEKAKELLRKTDMKMYEISLCVGYNNVEHFNRVFKKKENMSPLMFRNQGTSRNKK